MGQRAHEEAGIWTASMYAGRRSGRVLVRGLVAACSEDLRAWSKQATDATERVVKAYERARGDDPSFVPPEAR